MGEYSRKRKRDGVHVDGPWVPVPLQFLQSRACAELSPHALKLLVDLMAMLKPNAGRNGDLWPSADELRVRGWASDASRSAAMQELRSAGLVVTTRRASGKRCELIALTLWPLACDQKKLDVLRHHYACSEYGGTDDARRAPPTPNAPAVWRKARPAKPQNLESRHGTTKHLDSPQREHEPTAPTPCDPAAGALTPRIAA